MIEMTYDEWIAEGTRLFGDNKMLWRFVCPVCKYVATVAEYKAAGAPQEAIAFSCVGRWAGRKREAFARTDGPGPCDYAGGGLLRLNPIKVTWPNGKEARYFAFDESGEAV